VNDALGMLEVTGLTPTLVAVDAMEKTASVRVMQCELNDYYGICTKITGPAAAVHAAITAGREAAQRMGGQPVSAIIDRVDDRAGEAIFSPPEFNPLIEQDVVFFPQYEPATTTAASDGNQPMTQENFALGLIETQGFTAVFDAIDTACKTANVEVVGKEKLGGGYITIIIKGDLSAVRAAVEAGKAKAEDLGKVIAAHVIARPSQSVLGLLPR